VQRKKPISSRQTSREQAPCHDTVTSFVSGEYARGDQADSEWPGPSGLVADPLRPHPGNGRDHVQIVRCVGGIVPPLILGSIVDRFGVAAIPILAAFPLGTAGAWATFALPDANAHTPPLITSFLSASWSPKNPSLRRLLQESQAQGGAKAGRPPRVGRRRTPGTPQRHRCRHVDSGKLYERANASPAAGSVGNGEGCRASFSSLPEALPCPRATPVEPGRSARLAHPWRPA
jgi:hypothetical protein